MSDTPKPPPSWLIDGIGRIRAGLGLLHRSAVPPKVALLEIAQGAWLSQAMYVATKLRHRRRACLRTTQCRARRGKVGSDASATFRLMRALASNGILKQRRDGRFALTRVGQELRSDAPDTMAPMVELIGTPEHWEHWSSLLHAVRTGATAADEVRGMPIFEYLETRPEYAEVFNRAMTGVSSMAIESLGSTYDFSDRKLIVDVGGGHGALLGAVLRNAPLASGVLFDQPSVIAGAGAPLEAAGVRPRCTLIGGSFFESAARRRRCLSAQGDHSRLGRRSSADDPAQHSIGHRPDREAGDPRAGASRRCAAASRHVARPRDAGADGWPRTHRRPSTRTCWRRQAFDRPESYRPQVRCPSSRPCLRSPALRKRLPFREGCRGLRHGTLTMVSSEHASDRGGPQHRHQEPPARAQAPRGRTVAAMLALSGC